MAQWRKPSGPVVPAWVLEDITAPEVDEWLDRLYAEDAQLWAEAFTVIISTPSRPV